MRQLTGSVTVNREIVGVLLYEKWHVLGMLRLHCFRYQILETLHAFNIYIILNNQETLPQPRT